MSTPELLAKWDRTMIDEFSLGMYFKLILQTLTGAASGDRGLPVPCEVFPTVQAFFCFDSASKIIVYAWVNDEKNKRAYGSKSDAYRVFEKCYKTAIRLMIGVSCLMKRKVV